METRVTEIADGIHQLTTYVAEMDFSFNQYLVVADEPLLFHTGPRQMFPLVADAVAGVVPVDTLQWSGFGHVEADECGSMNQWLAAAPRSTVVQSMTGCMVSLTDLADRPPRPLATGQVLDIGGPPIAVDRHAPRAPWVGSRHLLRRDHPDSPLRRPLHPDRLPTSNTRDDILAAAVAGEDLFQASSLAPASGTTVRGLADLDIETLALMHGPAFTGDCGSALLALANDFDRRIATAQAG